MPNTVYFWNQIILWYKSKYESQERNYFQNGVEKRLTNTCGCVPTSVWQYYQAISEMKDKDFIYLFILMEKNHHVL